MIWDIDESMDRERFVRQRLGLIPDELQSRILRGRGKRGILNCSRQWGKSTITAAMAVHQAYFERKSLSIVLSPTGRQSGEFLKKAAEFVRRLGIRPRGDGTNDISLLLPNGSRIVGLPGKEGTIRGYSGASLVLVDEASLVPDESYKAVRPMLATKNGDLWLMSTPHGQRGFFWEEWTHGGERWQRFSAPATECARISKEFLEEELAAMGELWFGQEYLCQFVDVNDGMFSRELIEGAIGTEVLPLAVPRRW
jgi:hypothetical protein